SAPKGCALPVRTATARRRRRSSVARARSMPLTLPGWPDRRRRRWSWRGSSGGQVGDAYLTANSSEFFSSLAIDLRRRSLVPSLMFAGYANESIGYLPDAHDVTAKTYAAYQSPKFKGQFPFTERSGTVMVEGMRGAIDAIREN